MVSRIATLLAARLWGLRWRDNSSVRGAAIGRYFSGKAEEQALQGRLEMVPQGSVVAGRRLEVAGD